jgi:uncharacterized protein YkwD
MPNPEPAPSQTCADPPRRSRVGSIVLLAVLAAVVLAVLWLKWVSFQQSSASSHSSSEIKLSLLPGMLEITLHKGSLYPANDPWKSYLASEQICPGAERTDLPLNQQADTMVCLVNYARQQRGLPALITSSLLDGTSLEKAQKIVRCGDFAHDACGQDPVEDVRAAGYFGAWGENLYLGEGKLGMPRVALDGWLNSPEHRENLFRPEWRTDGIAVISAPRVGNYSNVSVWVNQFAPG